MVATSVINLCNRALADIGARASIASLKENSTEANACATLYTPTFESLAREANWNCLSRQIKLSLYAAAKGTPENPDGTGTLPSSPWQYAYLVPNDSLAIRYLVPNNNDTGTSSIPLTTVNNAIGTFASVGEKIRFEVSSFLDASNNPIQIILTNLPSAEAVYTADLGNNPEVWDSLFAQAFVYYFGAALIPPINLNTGLLQLELKKAQDLIDKAKARDGNEGFVSSDHIPDWLAARGGGNVILNTDYFRGNR